MTNFLGEYECKIDAKGRVMLPVALKKQVSPEAQERFVINRGIEKHLVLYPMNEWKKITEEINKLNLFVQKNRIFMRKFHNGATELDLDNTGRLLLPKGLIDYAGVDKDIVLFAYASRIEVWAKEEYDRMLNADDGDFASLAEEVMGDKKKKEGQDDVS